MSSGFLGTCVLVFALATAMSLVLTGVVRRHAVARDILDVPNARSSHTSPTPRGGGLAIVITFLLALPVLAFTGTLPWPEAGGILAGGGLVAAVGYLDDRGHIPARWRLVAHFAAAICVLVAQGGAPPLTIWGYSVEPGWAVVVLACIYLVWTLNLYNFMDGIDGIASVEAICACAGGALLYVVVQRPELALTPLALAGAVAGFLYWNFPPAKIFMGDAGSGFLGLVLAALSLQAAWVEPSLLWAWLIMLGVFVVDATLTLLRRLLRGERVYLAHRSHAYQYAARRFGRHRPVTLAVAAINLLWLLPIAILVAVGRIEGEAGMIVSYAPLIALAWHFHAGKVERGG